MDDVTLRIKGQVGQIAARALHVALGSLLDVLEAADRSASAVPHTWTLSTLRDGSAVAGLSHPSPGAALTLIDQGLQDLTSAASIPPGWSSEMVRKIRNLGRLVGRDGAEGVELTFRTRERPWNIDGPLTTHADTALQSAETTFGSVSGRVDSWSDRRERLLGITLDSGRTLSARFPAELARRIRDEAVGRHGEFWGTLERNAGGQPVSLQVVDFEVNDGPVVPVPPSSVRGILRDAGWTLERWVESRGG